MPLTFKTRHCPTALLCLGSAWNTHAQTHARAHARTHARTRAHTRAHAHACGYVHAQAAYEELTNRTNDYGTNILNVKIMAQCDDNYSDDELTMLPLYTHLGRSAHCS